MKAVIERIGKFEYGFGKNSNCNIKRIAEALTFDNPAYPFSQNKYITKFNKQKLTFRIGMLNSLIRYFDKMGWEYEITDYEYKMPDVVIDERLRGGRWYQGEAVEAFFRRRYGILSVPPRGGKTFIASEILRLFLASESQGDFLFIVDNITLFNQAKGDIERYFERYGGIDIGEIKAGNIDFSHRVTIAMIQTIQSTFSPRCKDNKKKRDLKKYLNELKFLCVDEIHDNCSDSKLKIYNKAKDLDYLLCLSATPYRSGAEVQNLKLMEWSGDIIYQITEDDLIRGGVLTEYKVFMMVCEHSSDIDDATFAQRREELIYHNKFRNGIICNLINLLKEMGLKTLVLFQSVEHGQEISRLSGETFISGETSGDGREREKRRFLEAEGGVLLASNIFKKGVTLPSVQILINADEGLEDAGTIQRKGRVLGVSDGKNRSLIIDFVDIFDEYFSAHSEARLNVYVDAVGEKNVSMLDVSDKSWKVTLKRWIEKWFADEKKKAL